MRLLRLTVGGFRNVADTTIELGGITAFVSPNNYGKSNLLDAIKFGIDFINESPRTRYVMMGLKDAVPLVPVLANSNFKFKFEFDDPNLGEYRFVRYGFSFSWAKDDESGRRIVDETIEICSKPSGKWIHYLFREDGQYRKSHDTRSRRTIHLDDQQLAIDVLTAIDDIAINPVIKQIKQLTFSLCSSIDTSIRFHGLPVELKSAVNPNMMATFDDIDLLRAMYQLRMSDNERYENLLSALYTLYPEFEDIEINSYVLKRDEEFQVQSKAHTSEETTSEDIPFTIRDEMYRMTIRSRFLNQPVDVNLMSSGTKRIIWLLTNVIIAQMYAAHCIAIEEIETSIHPKMIAQLLELLHENLDETPLLITSHSPYLIQYLKPRQIYIGLPNDDGLACFKRLEESKVKTVISAAYDRGLGLGEYLFELMSADSFETKSLLRFLEA